MNWFKLIFDRRILKLEMKKENKFEFLVERLLYELSNKGFIGEINIKNIIQIELILSYKSRPFGVFTFSDTTQVEKGFWVTFKFPGQSYRKNIYGFNYDEEAIYKSVIDFCLKEINKKELVVHCKIKPYDVYIGRGRCPNTGEYSIWANPYSHDFNSKAEYVVETREEAIKLYEQYVRTNPELINKLILLKDKILGCWCKTKKNPNQSCHGDIIIKLIDEFCSN